MSSIQSNKWNIQLYRENKKIRKNIESFFFFPHEDHPFYTLYDIVLGEVEVAGKKGCNCTIFMYLQSYKEVHSRKATLILDFPSWLGLRIFFLNKILFWLFPGYARYVASFLWYWHSYIFFFSSGRLEPFLLHLLKFFFFLLSPVTKKLALLYTIQGGLADSQDTLCQHQLVLG